MSAIFFSWFKNLNILVYFILPFVTRVLQHPEIKVHLEERAGSKYYYPNLWTFSRAEKEADTSFSNINKQFLYIMSASG